MVIYRKPNTEKNWLFGSTNPTVICIPDEH
jgi:hypothetical protein